MYKGIAIGQLLGGCLARLSVRVSLSGEKRTAGCYLNFLETASHILLPVFSHPMDRETVWEAENLFSKTIVPVDIHETAEEGGTLNCISWESM